MNKKTTYKYNFWSNGRVMEEIPKINNVAEGLWKSYWINGELWFNRPTKNRVLHGTTLEFLYPKIPLNIVINI